jgi:hypothetical protein
MYRCPDLFAFHLERLGIRTWEQSFQVRARTTGDGPAHNTEPCEDLRLPGTTNPRLGPRNVTRAQSMERRARGKSADSAGRTI